MKNKWVISVPYTRVQYKILHFWLHQRSWHIGCEASDVTKKCRILYCVGQRLPKAFKISHFYSSHGLDKSVASGAGASAKPMSDFEMPLGVCRTSIVDTTLTISNNGLQTCIKCEAATTLVVYKPCGHETTCIDCYNKLGDIHRRTF